MQPLLFFLKKILCDNVLSAYISFSALYFACSLSVNTNPKIKLPESDFRRQTMLPSARVNYPNQAIGCTTGGISVRSFVCYMDMGCRRTVPRTCGICQNCMMSALPQRAGVTPTVCLNRLASIPSPNKNETGSAPTSLHRMIGQEF